MPLADVGKRTTHLLTLRTRSASSSSATAQTATLVSPYFPWGDPSDLNALGLTPAPGVLASDFPLRQGTIQITVPTDLTPGYDYDIICEYPSSKPVSRIALTCWSCV